jgi:hypothetical protein
LIKPYHLVWVSMDTSIRKTKVTVVVIKNSACLDFIIPYLAMSSLELEIQIITLDRSFKEVVRGSLYYQTWSERLGVHLNQVQKSPESNKRIWLSFFLAKGSSSVVDAIQKFQPDVLFLDSTTSSRGFDFAGLDKYCFQSGVPLLLMPHAPHHGKEVAIGCLSLPEVSFKTDFRFLYPFKYERPWLSTKIDESVCVYVGYPGLEQEWLQQETLRGQPSNPRSVPNVIYFIRRFLPKGQDRADGDNLFVYSWDEFITLSAVVVRALNKQFESYNLVIKPHPSNSLELIRGAMATVEDLDSFSVTEEPMYYWLGKADFCVSLYSTAFFPFVKSKVPTVVLKTSTQQYIEDWPVLQNLYSQLSGYCENLNNIGKCIESVLANESVVRDAKLMTDYYPDGYVDTLDRLLVSHKNDFL